MFHVMRSPFSKTAFFILALAGCSLFEPPSEPAPTFAPQEQVFYAPFDRVWRAARIALHNYPIAVDNADKGLLETEIVRGDKVWRPPHKELRLGSGYRYSLSVRVIKGRVKDQSSIKVSVLKSVELQQNFFSEKKHLGSDGLEEQTILYRIGRELQIEQALRRAHQEEGEEVPE